MDSQKKDFIKKEDIKQEIIKFKQFAFKEDIIKISTAFIIGGAINKMANSLSTNIINPLVVFLIQKPENLWQNYEITLSDNAKIKVGNFLSSVFEFILVSLIAYIVYVKIIKNIVVDTNGSAENLKDCQYCCSKINKLATKCPQCASVIKKLSSKTKSSKIQK